MYIHLHKCVFWVEAGPELILDKAKLALPDKGFIIVWGKFFFFWQGRILFLTPNSDTCDCSSTSTVFIQTASLGRLLVTVWNPILALHMLVIGSYKIIHLLTGLVFHLVGWHATLLTSRKASGCAGLDTNHPSLVEQITRLRSSIMGTWNFWMLWDRAGTTRPEKRIVIMTRELQRYRIYIIAYQQNLTCQCEPFDGRGWQIHFLFEGVASNQRQNPWGRIWY